MPLPDLIEIVPLDKPVRAEITVPGSKSITNRALILAALAEGDVTLEGALWSEDTQIMVDALKQLGFEISVENDPVEFCNRQIIVRGMNGEVGDGGTTEKPLDLFVGNAGTAARFLAALACLGRGVYRLHGVPRMHERPQAALFQALRELGYRIDSPNNKLPAIIHGTGPRKARCRVSIEESSQFASALLLCASAGGWEIEPTGENAEESPYITMTTELIAVFPHYGGGFQIEPDASSGSYFLAAGSWVEMEGNSPEAREFSIRVVNWPVIEPDSSWQIDSRFALVYPEWAANAVIEGSAESNPANSTSIVEYSRHIDLGDSIMTAIVVSPLNRWPTKFIDLGRLRVQECERVVALRTELTKCGANVVEEGDSLTIYPSKLHGAEIETYDDHRMAMCFAILGLKVPGIKIKNPTCVKKTFPNFFQKMAAAPPQGLGTSILDGRTSRKLGMEELFAE